MNCSNCCLEQERATCSLSSGSSPRSRPFRVSCSLVIGPSLPLALSLALSHNSTMIGVLKLMTKFPPFRPLIAQARLLSLSVADVVTNARYEYHTFSPCAPYPNALTLSCSYALHYQRVPSSLLGARAVTDIVAHRPRRELSAARLFSPSLSRSLHAALATVLHVARLSRARHPLLDPRSLCVLSTR